ncbi:hypothetical protein HO173_012657 [Letharia columbiana]|uniref:Uncharacterized protein n=1 Tax=Letharia columbiana TaxID=112416 RepID=A0A8H6FFH4_9LECA|nr:uncharacterized protein HO173_012657 [Letharia columbiana]KAF6225934.1 hypothetical protein HO173_012657 [Letharia columbiana]
MDIRINAAVLGITRNGRQLQGLEGVVSREPGTTGSDELPGQCLSRAFSPWDSGRGYCRICTPAIQRLLRERLIELSFCRTVRNQFCEVKDVAVDAFGGRLASHARDTIGFRRDHGIGI